jgi:hypothetical protein
MAAAALAALSFSPALRAQDFKIGSRPVQVHGFASQGYLYSNQNNYLTMYTSHGSPAFTEGSLNLSMPVTDKFRIAAQGYDRKMGSIDDFRPSLDFAYGDFKVARWLGFRGGKVKTVMGLYNDTQDMAFLYPWALLPQGVYPTDLRTTFIAHTGGDVYGRVSLKKAGKLEYTFYGGLRSYDDREGYYAYTQSLSLKITSISGRIIGGDLRWLPVNGLTLGVSRADLTQDRAVSSAIGTITQSTKMNRPWVGYADYARGKWGASFEYRDMNDIKTIRIPLGTPKDQDKSTKPWFASASYRATPKLQLGVYHSSVTVTAPANPKDTASNHIYDEVGSARYDINRFWDVKAEGHFIEGYGDTLQAQGFYSNYNPQGLKPRTNLLMLRATFKF